MTKLFKKKTGMLSPRVVVRPHISWQFRLLIGIMGCLFLMLLSWGMYETGRRSVDMGGSAFFRVKSNDESYHVSNCLQKDGETLCLQLSELTRKYQIAQITNDDLAKQTRLLSRENNRLKEELDFFEHVMAGNTKIDSGISIHQFSLKKDIQPGIYRYTLSLVQGGQRPKDFYGSLKFFVNLQQNDQKKSVLLNYKGEKQNIPVNFKFYHRIEEYFKVSPDVIVDSMEVQIYEQNDAQVKLVQTVEPS